MRANPCCRTDDFYATSEEAGLTDVLHGGTTTGGNPPYVEHERHNRWQPRAPSGAIRSGTTTGGNPPFAALGYHNRWQPRDGTTAGGNPPLCQPRVPQPVATPCWPVDVTHGGTTTGGNPPTSSRNGTNPVPAQEANCTSPVRARPLSMGKGPGLAAKPDHNACG